MRLRLNNPLERRIIVTDLFDEVGNPLDLFYETEVRPPENLEFGEKAIHMNLNAYIRHVIRALEEEEEKLRYKMWKESNNESESKSDN